MRFCVFHFSFFILHWLSGATSCGDWHTAVTLPLFFAFAVAVVPARYRNAKLKMQNEK
jgi:hypothetical protein